MYCGSGVSACHNLLAMEHAGLRGAAALRRLVVGVVERSVTPGRNRTGHSDNESRPAPPSKKAGGDQ